MKLLDGYTLMHEHVKIDLSYVKQDEDACLDCYNETVAEFKKLYEFGVRNIVDVTNLGMGRDIAYMQRVAKETGIQILKSTGCYKDPFIPEELMKLNVEQLAQLMIQEIEQGYDGHDECASMIGEIGTSKNEWKACEKTLFDAAILAHKKTGKPIYTHTTLSTLAFEQANYLVEQGVQPKKIVIGHIDLSNDIEMIKKVLKTGVFVGFDTVGKLSYLSDDRRVEMLMELERSQNLDQVVISLDLTRKSHLKHTGGIGYGYVFETFIPMLKQAGMRDESIETILKVNPRRIMEDEII